MVGYVVIVVVWNWWLVVCVGGVYSNFLDVWWYWCFVLGVLGYIGCGVYCVVLFGVLLLIGWGGEMVGFYIWGVMDIFDLYVVLGIVFDVNFDWGLVVVVVRYYWCWCDLWRDYRCVDWWFKLLWYEFYWCSLV